MMGRAWTLATLLGNLSRVYLRRSYVALFLLINIAYLYQFPGVDSDCRASGQQGGEHVAQFFDLWDTPVVGQVFSAGLDTPQCPQSKALTLIQARTQSTGKADWWKAVQPDVVGPAVPSKRPRHERTK